MANLRAIRTRIKSVESTRQITKSMKMVAAAKLRKTQAAFADLKHFAELSGELLEEAVQGSPLGDENPYLHPHTDSNCVCYVLVLGNRGLCGTYNQALLRCCDKLIRESDRENYLIVCGRWGKDLIAASGLCVRESFEISDTPDRSEAEALTERLKQLYSEKTVDEIVLVYQRYRSVLVQTPESQPLLPLRRDGTELRDGEPEPAEAESDLIFEPNRESIVNTLLDLYIGNTVHAVLLEARTGEHSARMTAMTAATDNTEELLGDLTLELNHARQAAITTEITEIASGAEALRNSIAGG